MAIVMGVGSGVFGLLILACVARAAEPDVTPRFFARFFPSLTDSVERTLTTYDVYADARCRITRPSISSQCCVHGGVLSESGHAARDVRNPRIPCSPLSPRFEMTVAGGI